MKKSKLLGLGIAALGSVLSVAGAFALYVRGADDTGFSIGAATYTSKTDAVSYTLTGNTAPSIYLSDGTNGGTKLGEWNSTKQKFYSQLKYEFTLGANYASGLTVQDNIAGNLQVALTNVDSRLVNHMKVSSYFEGFTGVTDYYKNLYFGNMIGTSTENQMVTATTGITVDRNIAFHTSGDQKIVVYIDFFDLGANNGLDILAMNECDNPFDLSITLQQAIDDANHDWKPAYLLNTETLWQIDDQYVMAPNLKANSFEWIIQVKGSNTLTRGKPYNTKAATEADAWAGGDDLNFTNGTTYDVTWSGLHSDAANAKAV